MESLLRIAVVRLLEKKAAQARERLEQHQAMSEEEAREDSIAWDIAIRVNEISQLLDLLPSSDERSSGRC